MFADIVVPLLVPVVTGAVGASGLMIKDRRLARDTHAIREQALSDATAQVGFASEWWKALQLLGADAAPESNEKLLGWLADAEAMVTHTQRLAFRRNPVTLRRLFLMEPMHHRSSKLLRVAFWISVLWLCVGAIATATDASQKHQHGWVVSDIVGLIVSALIVLLLHIWAEASDQSVPVHSLDPPRTPQPTPTAPSRGDVEARGR